jgi:DNA-directed RNA polymerase specialized sigma24 family protein
MSIRGHNKALGDKVDHLMREAFKADIGHHASYAIYCLGEVRLRHSILYGANLINVSVVAPNPNIEAAKIQLKWINKYRESLFKSVVKLAVDLARRHRKPLLGDVVSESDLIQEAVLAAQHHVSLYQPIEGGITFTSYMYRAIDHHLSHYVNENTRTVALPRTIIDRYRPVYQAIEQVGSASLERIAQQATRNLYELKQQSSGRKLDREEAYTANEVHELMTYTQESLSLHDENWASLPFSSITSQVDIINAIDTTPTQEEKLDKTNVMSMLMQIIQECTATSEEYTVMEVRWGMGESKGLKTTAEIYKNATGRPMNKGKVAEIERRVLVRLKQYVADGDPRLLELKKVVDTLF